MTRAFELTPRQRQVVDFVRSYTSQHQCPPSVRDIRDHLGITSTNAVCELINMAGARGYLTWEERSPRTLRLTDKAKALPVLLYEGRVPVAEYRDLEQHRGRSWLGD